MKTKHIFGTILMATFAVACSNEDLQLVENPTQVGERIELGDVTLSLGEAESRFVVGDNFNDINAELGNKVGAALIDEPNNGGNDVEAKTRYDITDYISTNYAFEYNGSVWTTPAKMVEGNYMFYAPYNASHATRTPIVAKLDAVQNLVATTEGVDELSAIKQLVSSGNVMAVSHEFIAASDDANVETALLPIYAYPYITLTNYHEVATATPGVTQAVDLIVDQIVIKPLEKTEPSPGNYVYVADNFVIKAPFNLVDGNDVINTTTGFVGGLRDFSYYYWDGAWKTASKQGAFPKKLGKGAYTSDILDNADASVGKSSAIVVKAPQGYTLSKNGGLLSFYAVIPAESYDALCFEVYTDKGVFTKTVYDVAISAGKRYPEAEYNDAGTSLNAPSEGGETGAGAMLTVGLGVDTEVGVASTLVATTEDLVTFVKSAASTTTNGSGAVIANEVTVSALTSDVEINAAVMSAIKAKSRAGWTINFVTPVTIATNLDSSNKFINLNGGAIVKEGTVVLGSCATISNLTVTGGTVTINGANITSAITNKSTLVLNSNVTAAITNEGAITIADPISATITNNGSSAALTIGDGNYVSGTEINKNFNALTVYNTNGSIEVKAKTTAVVASNAADETITNYGSLTVTANSGTINNNGSLTVSTNNGHVDMKLSTASVTVNAGTGSVNNTKDATVNVTGGTQEVYFEFTSDVNGQLIPEASTYNTIRLTGMTWKATDDQIINEPIKMKDATVSLYVANKKLEFRGGLTVVDTTNDLSAMKGNANSEINIAGTVTSSDKLTITGIKVYDGGTLTTDGSGNTTYTDGTNAL